LGTRRPRASPPCAPRISSWPTARAVATRGNVATARGDLRRPPGRRPSSPDPGAAAAHAATAPRGSPPLRGRRLRLAISLEHVLHERIPPAALQDLRPLHEH